MNKRVFVSDIKRIVRDPILMLFMLVPFFALFAIKAMLIFGMPLLTQFTGFIIDPYLGYVEVICLIVAPVTLGDASAFMLIDERDGGVYDLMSVTPVGFSGYIANRLLMPFVLSMIYTILFHLVLNIYSVSVLALILITFLAGLQSIVSALFLFSLADDKVKGLTLAKALNIFVLTSMSGLLNIPVVTLVSALFPFYWSAEILMHPSLFNAVAGISVNLIWVGVACKIISKNR